jgi:CheY-like chemotaxis protein
MTVPQTVPCPAVLVVDDEPIVLRLMERALRAAGYEVHAVSDPMRALELASSLAVPAALLVTDIRMSPLDGPDLARRMAEVSPGTRILFVSGFQADPERRALAGPLLKKPFSPSQLIEAAARILGSRVSPPGRQPSETSLHFPSM